MHHRYTWTIGAGIGAGSMGFLGRAGIALLILLLLKHFDKKNPEYDKGIKALLLGGAATVILGFFVFGIFIAATFLPFVINW